jgi:hypothetical protein
MESKIALNKNEPEDFERVIGKGGLYAPQPLPAQIVLAYAKEFTAQRLLLALSSYLGPKNSRVVYPTYKMSQTTISTALSVLINFGFIKLWKSWRNGREYNKYYFQDSCWHHYKMNELARSYLPDLGICACGEIVKEGDFTFGITDYHHFKDGGVVTLLPTSTKYLGKLTNLRARALHEARNPDSLPGEK